MNNSTNMSEKLVQYLDGELSAADSSAIAVQLKADSSLKDEYSSLLATKEAVMLYGLQQQVAGIHKQMMEQLQRPIKKIGSVRKIVRYSTAVAASIILLIAGIWGYNFYTLSSNKVFSANYQVYEPANYRDGTANLSPVQKAYADKDYEKVIALNVGTATLTAPPEEDMLTAISMLELKQNARAIDEFKEVITKSAAPAAGQLKDAAEYYLSLTYIRNGDYDFALELLRKIREDKQHTYNSKVTAKLIRQVKLLKWR